MKRLLYVFILLLPFVIKAQIVNIENQRLHAQQEGWKGNMSLNFNYNNNGVEVYQVGSRFNIQYKEKRHTGFFLTEINFIKAGENSFINNGFEHMRYNYDLSDSGRFVVEAFRQSQYNKVQNIRLRSLYGAGIRCEIIRQDSAILNIGALPMLEFEDLTTDENNRHLRLSSYLSFDIQFSKSIGLNSITYYQPDMLNWKDLRMANETSLRLQLHKRLQYQMRFRWTYDEYPPTENFRRTYTVSNMIRFSF